MHLNLDTERINVFNFFIKIRTHGNMINILQYIMLFYNSKKKKFRYFRYIICMR